LGAAADMPLRISPSDVRMNPSHRSPLPTPSSRPRVPAAKNAGMRLLIHIAAAHVLRNVGAVEVVRESVSNSIGKLRSSGIF
jgi:hypothetical protein